MPKYVFSGDGGTAVHLSAKEQEGVAAMEKVYEDIGILSTWRYLWYIIRSSTFDYYESI